MFNNNLLDLLRTAYFHQQQIAYLQHCKHKVCKPKYQHSIVVTLTWGKQQSCSILCPYSLLIEWRHSAIITKGHLQLTSKSISINIEAGEMLSTNHLTVVSKYRLPLAVKFIRLPLNLLPSFPRKLKLSTNSFNDLPIGDRI